MRLVRLAPDLAVWASGELEARALYREIFLDRSYLQHGVVVGDGATVHDVERSELEVVQRIAPDDWSKIRQLVVEVHDVDGRVDQIATCLRGLGFRVTIDPTAGGSRHCSGSSCCTPCASLDFRWASLHDRATPGRETR